MAEITVRFTEVVNTTTSKGVGDGITGAGRAVKVVIVIPKSTVAGAIPGTGVDETRCIIVVDGLERRIHFDGIDAGVGSIILHDLERMLTIGQAFAAKEHLLGEPGGIS